jgi:hypothetical protein
MILVPLIKFWGMGNRMGAVLKPSDKQGCHIWYYMVSRSSVDTQTSPPAVISRVTEHRSACFNFIFLICEYLVCKSVISLNWLKLVFLQ